MHATKHTSYLHSNQIIYFKFHNIGPWLLIFKYIHIFSVTNTLAYFKQEHPLRQEKFYNVGNRRFWVLDVRTDQRFQSSDFQQKFPADIGKRRRTEEERRKRKRR